MSQDFIVVIRGRYAGISHQFMILNGNLLQTMMHFLYQLMHTISRSKIDNTTDILGKLAVD